MGGGRGEESDGAREVERVEGGRRAKMEWV